MLIVYLLALINASTFIKGILMEVVKRRIFAKMYVRQVVVLMTILAYVFAMVHRMSMCNVIKNVEIMPNRYNSVKEFLV